MGIVTFAVKLHARRPIWGPMRTFVLILILTCPSAAGGLGDWFGSRRSDPEVESIESYLTEPIELEQRRVCIFPFQVRQGGAPKVPDLRRAFREAIEFNMPETEAIVMDRRPESGLAPWQLADLDLRGELHAAARKAACDYYLDGSVRRAYRKPSGGYVIDVETWLTSASRETPELRWRARKRLDWRKRQSVNECTLYFAEEVVFDWMFPPPEPGPAEETDSVDATIEAPAHAATRTLHPGSPSPSSQDQTAPHGLRRRPD